MVLGVTARLAPPQGAARLQEETEAALGLAKHRAQRRVQQALEYEQEVSSAAGVRHTGLRSERGLRPVALTHGGGRAGPAVRVARARDGSPVRPPPARSSATS